MQFLYLFLSQNLERTSQPSLLSHQVSLQLNHPVELFLQQRAPVRSTYGGYYGLVVVPPRPRPRPQTLHRSHDNLKNPYRIASIFYM